MIFDKIIENLPIDIVRKTFQELLKKEYFLYKLTKEKSLRIGDSNCPYFLFFGNYFKQKKEDEIKKMEFSESHLRKILKKYFNSKKELQELLKLNNRELIFINLDLAKIARKTFRLVDGEQNDDYRA